MFNYRFGSTNSLCSYAVRWCPIVSSLPSYHCPPIIPVVPYRQKKRYRLEYSPGSTPGHSPASCSPTQLLFSKQQLSNFFKLLDDDVLSLFLERDQCCVFADKYLLATVFVYFVRADFDRSQYTRTNFFVALFLAHEIHEDDEDYRFEVLPWVFGEHWRRHVGTLHRQRDILWRRIHCRAIVSRKCCEEVMSIEPGHWCWNRDRPEHHSGAFRSNYTSPLSWQGPFGPRRLAPACLQCSSGEGSSESSESASSSLDASCCQQSLEISNVRDSGLGLSPSI